MVRTIHYFVLLFVKVIFVICCRRLLTSSFHHCYTRRNFTSRMMIINPLHLIKLLNTSYDVVHVVMPANISSMWILAAFKVLRCLKREAKPALVVSWHCNIVDYMQHFAIGPLKYIAFIFFYLLFGMLPLISDRILTPTKKSEPHLVNMWRRSNGKLCAGVCFTGVNKTEFSPAAKYSNWGQTWATSKEKYLSKMGKKHLIVVSVLLSCCTFPLLLLAHSNIEYSPVCWKALS